MTNKEALAYIKSNFNRFVDCTDDNIALHKAMQALENNIEQENKPYAHWGSQVLCQVDFYDLKVGYICPCCHKFVPNKGKYCLECGERIEG